MNNQQDKIIQSRINLYVATLVGNNIALNISDLSSDSEQIILVQCNDEIGKYSFGFWQYISILFFLIRFR
jgi:hypothetical protein